MFCYRCNTYVSTTTPRYSKMLSSFYKSFNQHWHKADKVGLTCWSANPAAQQRRPTSICQKCHVVLIRHIFCFQFFTFQISAFASGSWLFDDPLLDERCGVAAVNAKRLQIICGHRAGGQNGMRTDLHARPQSPAPPTGRASRAGPPSWVCLRQRVFIIIQQQRSAS